MVSLALSCANVLVTVVSLVAILLAFCPPALSNGQQCSSATQYTVYDDKTGKTKCLNCPACGAGLELVIRCGSLINATVTVGECQSCKNGTTFSTGSDHLPCKTCSQCDEHEMVVQECHAKEDTQCSPKCSNGLVWQNNTCQPIDVPVSTAKADELIRTTPKNSSMPTDDKSKIGSSHMAFWEVLLIVLGVVFAVLGIIGLCCWLNKGSVHYETAGKYMRTMKNCISRNGGNARVGDDIEGNVEEIQENRAPADVNTAPTEESLGGYASTSPTVTCSDISPQLNHPIVVDEQVYSPDDGNLAANEPQQRPRGAPPAPGQPVQREQLALNRAPQQPGAQALHDPCVQYRSPRLCELDFNLYHEICREFDHGPPGMDCDALACKMNCFTAAQMREFGKNEKKAHLLIQFWEGNEGNDALKFVEILNALKMTYYANKLADCIHGMNGDRQ